VAATATAPLLGFAWTSGLVVASVAMSGDLLSSFLKRRLSLPPSSRASGIDQIPECLLPTIAIRSTLGLGAFDIISVVIIFFLGQVLLSQALFRWNIRNRPY
jgi:CDP-2,3-bis-(O-geranylgeranyl)-sn-glycerol synthase